MPDIIEKLLRLNPQVNKKRLKESILLAQQLAEDGIVMSEYNLESPFSRRRIKRQKSNTKLEKHIKRQRMI